MKDDDDYTRIHNLPPVPRPKAPSVIDRVERLERVSAEKLHITAIEADVTVLEKEFAQLRADLNAALAANREEGKKAGKKRDRRSSTSIIIGILTLAASAFGAAQQYLHYLEAKNGNVTQPAP